MLALVANDSYTLDQFPQVSVQDCATNPEDIDGMSTWMMQDTYETELEGALIVRFLFLRNGFFTIVGVFIEIFL